MNSSGSCNIRLHLPLRKGIKEASSTQFLFYFSLEFVSCFLRQDRDAEHVESSWSTWGEKSLGRGNCGIVNTFPLFLGGSLITFFSLKPRPKASREHLVRICPGMSWRNMLYCTPRLTIGLLLTEVPHAMLEWRTGRWALCLPKIHKTSEDWG